MNTNDLKRLAGRAEAESRSRAAADSLPDAAAAEGLLDVAVGNVSSPIGELFVVVTGRGLAAIAFEGDEYRRGAPGSDRAADLTADPAVAEGHGLPGAASWTSTSRLRGRGSSCPSTAGSSTGSRATS